MKRYLILFPVMFVLSIATSCFDYMDDMAFDVKLNEGLVAYWPMNEQYPDPELSVYEPVKDYSGNNNDLTLEDTSDGSGTRYSAYSVAGKFNNALLFNSGNYAFASLYKTNLLRSNNEFSISLWIKDTTSMLPIITTQGFRLSSDNLTDISLTVNGVPNVTAESFPAWTTINQWTHIAGIYDKNNICIYVNGVLVAKTPCSNSLIQTNKLVICTEIDSGGNYESCRTATLDEIRIYNRALSQDEIKALMDIGRD